MLMLYPCVIAFTLAARYTKYGLLIPTPNVPGAAPPSPDLARAQDEWLTTSQEALWFTGICFGAVSLIHIFLVFYITLKGPRESPRMSRAFAWLAPMAFWFGTCAYFFVFTILARYGVAWQEWVLFGAFTLGLFFITAILICVAVSLAKVVEAPPAQVPVEGGPGQGNQ
ncbi:hypothetical protein SETIT_2G396700v2 [Setaria italica]|uniref:Uncharacterized protein n=2 Tax=Setaria italica TaxID=4555 RepID=A0A368Q8M3_SETIT|nr:hypothetical protein SETIT_2G396700v2 [Setaria italica]